MKKKLINILVVILSLLFLELAVSFFFILKPNPTIGILFRPFASYENIKFSQRIEHFDYKNNKYMPGVYKSGNITYLINSHGFRGPEFKKNNLPRCTGIAYGGSTTVGLEVRYEKTYPKLLEDNLNKYEKKCRVLNAGVSSKSINYIYRRMITEIEKYNPLFVTIYSNRNSAMYDATSSNINSDILTSNFDLTLFKIKFFLEKNIMTYKFLNESIYRILENSFETPHPYDLTRRINLQYFEKDYFNIIKNIYEYLKNKNINLVLIKQIHYIDSEIQIKLQKNTFQENLKLLKNYNKLDLATYKNSHLSVEEKINNYFMITNVLLNQNMENFKENYNDIILVDPLNIFFQKKKDEMFYDGLHLKEEGNILLSNIIYAKIKNEKFLID